MSFDSTLVWEGHRVRGMTGRLDELSCSVGVSWSPKSWERLERDKQTTGVLEATTSRLSSVWHVIVTVKAVKKGEGQVLSLSTLACVKSCLCQLLPDLSFRKLWSIWSTDRLAGTISSTTVITQRIESLALRRIGVKFHLTIWHPDILTRSTWHPDTTWHGQSWHSWHPDTVNLTSWRCKKLSQRCVHQGLGSCRATRNPYREGAQLLGPSEWNLTCQWRTDWES